MPWTPTPRLYRKVVSYKNFNSLPSYNNKWLGHRNSVARMKFSKSANFCSKVATFPPPSKFCVRQNSHFSATYLRKIATFQPTLAPIPPLFRHLYQAKRTLPVICTVSVRLCYFKIWTQKVFLSIFERLFSAALFFEKFCFEKNHGRRQPAEKKI